MIIIKDRKAIIPYEESHIGVVGDNAVEVRRFQISDSALFPLAFKLDLAIGEHVQIVDLSKVVESDKIILTWEIEEQHLPEAGEMTAQLRAFNPDGVEKWHSIDFVFVIDESINATEYYPPILPSEFEQMEQRVTAMQTDVTQKAIEVSENTATVDEKTQTVIDKAAEALQSAAAALASERAAKQNEDNAKSSENSALEAMQTAMQAMQDLLAMMGSDIATLTNGKLTPSQIPAIAVTDTFVVSTEAAMLALVAQTGDVCIRTDESKSYILQGANPSILSHWQRIQSPTNYADTAGHAATADEATNATMINNHRIVKFDTIAELEAATKVSGTLYYAPYEEE